MKMSKWTFMPLALLRIYAVLAVLLECYMSISQIVCWGVKYGTGLYVAKFCTIREVLLRKKNVKILFVAKFSNILWLPGLFAKIRSCKHKTLQRDIQLTLPKSLREVSDNWQYKSLAFNSSLSYLSL
jgi:hypothetical protein